MSYAFRLLETGFNPAAFNMGLDEALLHSVAERQSMPTIRFYGWAPPAVTIGYFQGLREEIDLEACNAAGVDVVRRITGGGAVFHHHEATYSLVIPLSHPLARENILDSYRLLLSGFIEGFSELGIKAEFSPINDISVDGKKISGNAQTRKMGCILQHGTILIDVEVDLMFSLLKVPKEKSQGKLLADAKSHVTSIRQCLGKPENTSFESLFSSTIQALERGCAKALDFDFVPSEPSAKELEMASMLARDKFSSREWLEMR